MTRSLLVPCCSDGRCPKCADRLRAHIARLEASLMAALRGKTRGKTRGASKCPDCGSLRFGRGGAAALDEARVIGFWQGVEAARLRPRFPATAEGGKALVEWKHAHPDAAGPATLADRLKSPTLRAEIARARERLEEK